MFYQLAYSEGTMLYSIGNGLELSTISFEENLYSKLTGNPDFPRTGYSGFLSGKVFYNVVGFRDSLQKLLLLSVKQIKYTSHILVLWSLKIKWK